MHALAVVRRSLLLVLVTLSAAPLAGQDAGPSLERGSMLVVDHRPSPAVERPSTSPAELLRTFPELDPRLSAGHALLPATAIPMSSTALDAAAAGSSLGRSVGLGALIGASAGVVTGLLVRAWCDEYCDDSVAEGMALHIGIGALVGGATGALIHWIRDE